MATRATSGCTRCVQDGRGRDPGRWAPPAQPLPCHPSEAPAARFLPHGFQLIEANKRDFQALLSARALAATLEQRAAAEADLAALARKRGPRAERWEAAFRVLHAELAAIKASLAAFVTSCRAAAFANGSASCAAQAQAQARRAAADLAVGPDVEEI